MDTDKILTGTEKSTRNVFCQHRLRVGILAAFI